MEETVIIPLAKDLNKKDLNTINTKEAKNESLGRELWSLTIVDKIAVLSNSYDEAYRVKIEEILLSHGQNVKCIKPKNITVTELRNCLLQLVDEVRLGKYKLAVIISPEAYYLKQEIGKFHNLTASICWEIDEKNQCLTKSRFLFINNDLIGFKMLDKKISTWLKFNDF